jgi:D-alanyl-D-alanine carboxypeptidase
MQKTIIRIGIGTGTVLLIPLFLTLLAIWHWRPGALVLAFVLVLGAAGLTYELVVAKKMINKAYRFAVAMALAAVLLLVWMNVAVGGILGDDPANMMYFGVLLVGLVGAIIARLEPEGMSRVLLATALAMALVPAIALMIGTPAFANGVPAVFALHACYAMVFVGSALLFRRAAREPTKPDMRYSSMKVKILLGALLTLMLVGRGYAQTMDKAKLDQFFDRLAEKNKAMGSLVIVKHGEIVYSRAIGFSQINGAEKKPLTAASRFRIGSITKMYTAVMVMQLVEKGKLKFSDTLDKFFPQVPNAPKITIEQILSHRSGIPNVRRDREAQKNVHTIPMAKDEMLALIVKGTPDFEPGEKHRYSNSGYQLLGLILEQVTGKSYADALEERITSKIGLRDTYLATGNIDVSKNEALTYIHFGGDWKQHSETHPSILFSAGAIVSTPGDLAKFIQALFELKLISQESLNAMKTIRDGDGLGMEPFTFAGKTFYGHGGGGDNYGAWLAYLPEEKLAVAYTTNAKIYPVGNIVRGVVEIYYNKPFEIPALESIALSPEILDKYVGVYSNPDAPVKLTITREGGTLFFQPPGAQSAAPLEATAEDKFQIERAVVVEFDAARNQMTVKRRGGERVFTKEK